MYCIVLYYAAPNVMSESNCKGQMPYISEIECTRISFTINVKINLGWRINSTECLCVRWSLSQWGIIQLNPFPKQTRMNECTCLCFLRDSTGLAVNAHNGLLVRMMNKSTAFPFSVAHVMGRVQSVLPPGIWKQTVWKRKIRN